MSPTEIWKPLKCFEGNYEISNFGKIKPSPASARGLRKLTKENEMNDRSKSGGPNLDRMKYLGVLSLLCECSVYVDEDLRDSIERALEDACSDGRLQYRRILNRYEIEVVRPKDTTNKPAAQSEEVGE